MGRFHLAHFDAEPSQLLRMAMPVFEDAQRKPKCWPFCAKFDEAPSRRALGVKDVLEALSGGRVQKLIVDRLPGQTISECKSCGRMMAAAGHDCTSCGSAVSYMPAEEGLVRQALLTDAEILFAKADAVPGFSGAAACLRY